MGDILCGIIPFVITLVLSLIAMKRSSGAISPVVLVMMSFYASFLFTYAGTYTGHLLSGIFALVAFIFIKKKKYFISGLLVGFALATEFPVGILFPVWAALIYLNEKKISKTLAFAAGIIPGLLIVLWYNYHLTGSFIKTPYSYEAAQHIKQDTGDIGFYFPKLSALWGLVFSTYRGVFYYTPVLILMLWYLFKNGYEKMLHSLKNKTEFLTTLSKNYLFFTITVYLLLYSAYYQWTGGWAFGPRYLIPVVMIALYEGLLYLSTVRISAYFFYAITAFGLLYTWLDKSTKIFLLPDKPAIYGNPLSDIIWPDFMNHKLNPNMLPVFTFDWSPLHAVYFWPILFLVSIIGLSLWYNKLYPAKQ